MLSIIHIGNRRARGRNAGIAYYNYLLSIGVQENFARMLIAQAAHETGGFRSRIYLQNNNLFGMRMPRIRKTVAVRELDTYAYYNSSFDSLDDMILWLNARRSFNHAVLNMNIENYTRWLREQAFYEDTHENYSRGVQQWYNQIFG